MDPHRPHTSLNDMGDELPYSKTSHLNHTIDYLITLTYNISSPITQSGSRAGSIIHQSVHETESRAIASRCPKLRTSKGHLVYKGLPARSQLRSRKPILRHACYNIHASHMPCMNNRYHCNSLQSIHFIDNSYRVNTEITSM